MAPQPLFSFSSEDPPKKFGDDICRTCSQNSLHTNRNFASCLLMLFQSLLTNWLTFWVGKLINHNLRIIECISKNFSNYVWIMFRLIFRIGFKQTKIWAVRTNFQILRHEVLFYIGKLFCIFYVICCYFFG